MRIKKLRLKKFRRFDDLTIDLGAAPKKIVALVGPNGTGKSCVFDAFEHYSKKIKGGRLTAEFASKSMYSEVEAERKEDHSVEIDSDTDITKNSIYIRTSYRYTPRIDVKEMKSLPAIEADPSPKSSIDEDGRLIRNYERYLGAYWETMDSETTGKQWQKENIEKLNKILENLLEIKITSLGNPSKGQGQLYFSKGKSKKFPYENLSSGEKEVIDIIMDFIVKVEVYSNTTFCLDEPELHISTKIQRKLIAEIEKLVPDNCQLWIATHSIGFLRALQIELKDKADIIDFSNLDFDKPIEVRPVIPDRKTWLRIFETAVEDLKGLIAPKVIIYCEGRKDLGQNGEELGIDAQIYNAVFSKEFPDVQFVSSGGSTEPDKYSGIALEVLSKAFLDVQILLLKDRDINGSGAETTLEQRDEWLNQSKMNRMLFRKELENYLYDYEVLSRYNPELTEDAYAKVVKNPIEDNVKKSDGFVMSMVGIKTGFNKSEFKSLLATFITPDTKIYQELRKVIFG